VKVRPHSTSRCTSFFSSILYCCLGLLCCFAARLDAAKHVVKSLQVRERAARRGVRDVSRLFADKRKPCYRLFSGYFYGIIIAYAIGLLIANVAVHLMQRGQPALLYLVPLTLGTIVAQGNIREELVSLWRGPRRIAIADFVVSLIYLEGAGRVGTHALDEDSSGGTRSIISESEMELSCDGEVELPRGDNRPHREVA